MKQKLTAAFILAVASFAGSTLFAQEATFRNSLGMEFVLIRPGSILIGRYLPTVGEYQEPKAEPGEPLPKVLPPSAYRLAETMAAEATMPGFKFALSKPYYMGKYEVTQEQWQTVMGANPSWFQVDRVSDDAKLHPAENITWKDAQAFIKKLNQIDKDHVYRLPGEFEWEYAAAAGAPDDISWAKAAATGVISDTTTRMIGSKQPNDWGLYDMIGNVWEWVQDAYNEKIFADPIPPQRGKQHVLKGASFTGDAKNATYKTHAAGPGNGFDIGLRVLMEVREE